MAKVTLMDNGLRVITQNLPHALSAAVGLWVGVGSRYEPEEQHGIVHLVEHTVFKGTRRRDDSYKIAREIERVGGDLNAETCKEYTGFTAQVPAGVWPTALDVLFDMVTGPLFREADLRSEASVVVEEIADYRDTPSEHVLDLAAECLWPGQALGRTELGSESSVRALDAAALFDFLRFYYVPANMTLSVVGNVPDADVLEWVEANCQVRQGARPPAAPAASENQRAPAVLVSPKDTEETHLCLGLRTVPRGHQDLDALRVLRCLLGEGMGSRLFQEVRDKRGLAYRIGTNLNRFRDTGALLIYAGVDSRSAEQAVQVILEVLTGIRAKQQPSDREVEDAKEQYLGMLSLQLERTLALTEWLGQDLLLEENAPGLENLAARVRRLTSDDLVRVADVYFRDDRLNLAVIGPHAAGDAFQDVRFP